MVLSLRIRGFALYIADKNLLYGTLTIDQSNAYLHPSPHKKRVRQALFL